LLGLEMQKMRLLHKIYQYDLLTRITFFGNIKAEIFSERVGSDAPGNGC